MKQTGNVSMKLESARREALSYLVAVWLLLPCTLFADEQASDPASTAGSMSDASAVTEGAADATQGRAKAQQSVNALSVELQDLKQSVIALNKNLRVLEEDLLFPANTQLTVFLSLDVGKFFTLETVKLNLDGKLVTSHTYNDKEVVALARGGVHRVHVANLSVGDHSLSAFFTGIGPNGRSYKRGTTLKISKKTGPKYVELRVSDSSLKLQPEFSVREW